MVNGRTCGFTLTATLIVMLLVAALIVRHHPSQTVFSFSPFNMSPNTSLLQRAVQQRDELSRQLNFLQVRIYLKYVDIK